MPVRETTWRPVLSEGTTHAMLLDLPKYVGSLFLPHIWYLIYMNEKRTVSLQLLVEGFVCDSLYMSRIQYTPMHAAYISCLPKQ